MLDYHLLKTIHIISSTLLFGTGLGTGGENSDRTEKYHQEPPAGRALAAPV